MFKLFVTGCALLAGVSGFAQQVTINWGEESKAELRFGSFVKGDGANSIKLCFEGGSSLFSNKVATPVLVNYSDKLAELNVRKFEVTEKNVSFNNLLSVKGKLFMFTNQYDKEVKATTFFSQEIDPKTLVVKGTNVSLGSFESVKKSAQSTVSYELSKDSSKILMFGLAPRSSKENERYYIGVYDNDMKKHWEKTVVLPYPDKYIVVLDELVTNEGKVGVIIKHYDQEVSREAVRENGEKVPSYKTKMLLYDSAGAKPKEFLLGTGSKFIHTLQLTSDVANNLIMFGLYKDRYNGYISGYLVANIDKSTGAVTTQNMQAFPDKLIDQVKIDNQGSNRERDPGLSDKFKLATTVDREDGSKDYLIEYQSEVYVSTSYSSGNGNWVSDSYWQYNYGDIIDISIKPGGSTTIARIPKMQVSRNVRYFSNFQALPYHNKVLLFYNDDDDNLKRDLSKQPDNLKRFAKSAFAMAVVDEQGAISRKALFSHRDMRLITAVRECNSIGKNRIGLYALREGVFIASKDMVGILDVL